VTAYAAGRGHLEVLKWATTRRGYSCATDAEYAVRGGHISILQWLYENQGHECQLLHLYAARACQLKVLKWLKEIQSPVRWDRACLEAIAYGQLEVLEWLLQEVGGKAMLGLAPERIMRAAVERGNMDIIKWLSEHGCILDRPEMVYAAKVKGFTEIQKWLDETE